MKRIVGGSKTLENDMNTIDALKRLERAGSEYSRTTRKLQDTVQITAEAICKTLATANIQQSNRDWNLYGEGCIHIAISITSPYFFCWPRGRKDMASIMVGAPDSKCTELLNSHDGVLPSRDLCVIFSRDIANGLLNLIAEWLEKHVGENETCYLRAASDLV